MKPIKTHTFNRRKYLITVSPKLDGMCDTFKKEREIVLMAPLKTRAGLITAVHEAMHALDWKASEGRIDKDSKELGGFLWRLGYRRVQ